MEKNKRLSGKPRTAISDKLDLIFELSSLLLIALLLIPTVVLILAASSAPATEPLVTKELATDYEAIPLAAIWKNPHYYINRRIVVTGSYLGWKGQVSHPGITRSDWAVADESGAIYVTGKPADELDPIQDLGCKVKIWGVVQVNPKGIPYIKAHQIQTLPDR